MVVATEHAVIITQPKNFASRKKSACLMVLLRYHTGMTEMLHKVRKGHTAQFGFVQWGEALKALGFTVNFGRTGRKIATMTIQAPQGSTITIESNPGYEVPRWIQREKIDLVVLASQYLGLPTPEAERELKKLASRDLNNTGTCPVCLGVFKRARDGGMVHHGFERPGDGEIHGDCFGVGYQPWELEPTGLKLFLELKLQPVVLQLQEDLEDLESGNVKSLFVPSARSFSLKEILRSHPSFDYELDRAIWNCRARLWSSAAHCVRVQERLVTWAPGELPEIKHAKK